MLIIQIALGIVLAVILLAFLPQIFTLTIWAVIAAIAIAAVGAILYFFTAEPAAFLLIVVLPIAAFYIYKKSSDDSRRLYVALLKWLPIAAIVVGLLALYFIGNEPLALVLLAALGVGGTILYFDFSKNSKENEKNRRKRLGYDD